MCTAKCQCTVLCSVLCTALHCRELEVLLWGDIEWQTGWGSGGDSTHVYWMWQLGHHSNPVRDRGQGPGSLTRGGKPLACIKLGYRKLSFGDLNRHVLKAPNWWKFVEFNLIWFILKLLRNCWIVFHWNLWSSRWYLYTVSLHPY